MLNGCAYILTVDVGNTFIRFGLFAEDSAAAQECPLATCEITTPSSITADEARMRLAQVMAALAADAGMPGALVPAAAVLSCVVPALERPWKAALSRTCTGRVLTVGPGLKTGMPVHYDDPAEIGPDRIADAVLSEKIDHLETVAGKIFREVEEHPEKQQQAATFLNYYLPTTLKLLNAYDRMGAQGVNGENIDNTMQRVESMMSTIVAAFEKQLDMLFGSEAMDISTDITVLENMMKREGLSEGDGVQASGGTATASQGDIKLEL